jgi:hypothetical protein
MVLFVSAGGSARLVYYNLSAAASAPLREGAGRAGHVAGCCQQNLASEYGPVLLGMWDGRRSARCTLECCVISIVRQSGAGEDSNSSRTTNQFDRIKSVGWPACSFENVYRPFGMHVECKDRVFQT